MKAVYMERHGGPEVLTYGEVQEPQVGPSDVRIRVRACALNRLDLYMRAGIRGTTINFDGPHVLGADVSGEIVGMGDSVIGLEIGMRVLVNPRGTCMQCSHCLAGTTEFCSRATMVGSKAFGGYAEYLIVPSTSVHQIPDTLDFVQAASLPTVFMPSWNILVRTAQLKSWETVLVPSASSGVGTAAIQVARNISGATVIASTSTEEKMKKALDIGANYVVNYRDENLGDRIKDLTNGKGVDVVIDHVGTDLWNAVNKSLALGARYGICGVTSGYRAELQMGAMFTRYLTMFGVFMGRPEDLRQIIHYAGIGSLQGIIHATYPLEDARKAHEDMEALNFFGKLVLTVE